MWTAENGDFWKGWRHSDSFISILQFKLLFDALPIIRNGDEKDKTERVLADAVSSLTKLIQRYAFLKYDSFTPCMTKNKGCLFPC